MFLLLKPSLLVSVTVQGLGMYVLNISQITLIGLGLRTTFLPRNNLKHYQKC